VIIDAQRMDFELVEPQRLPAMDLRGIEKAGVLCMLEHITAGSRRHHAGRILVQQRERFGMEMIRVEMRKQQMRNREQRLNPAGIHPGLPGLVHVCGSTQPRVDHDARISARRFDQKTRVPD
jgi:hypothetical protein